MTTKQLAWPAALKPLAFPIDQLKPDPGNARRHNERNMAAIEASLRRHGWRGVVVARRKDKRILAGHGRIEAARRQGETTAPVLFVDGNDAQAAAFAVADNRTAELAGWSAELLSEALSELTQDEQAELAFTMEEIHQLTNATLPVLDDEQQAPQSTPAAAAPSSRTDRKGAATVQPLSVLFLFDAAEHKRWKAAVQRRLAAKTPDMAHAIVQALEAAK